MPSSSAWRGVRFSFLGIGAVMLWMYRSVLVAAAIVAAARVSGFLLAFGAAMAIPLQSIDAANWLLRRHAVGMVPGSNRWILACLGAWALVLLPQLPLWAWLMLSRPVLVAHVHVTLAIGLYIVALRCLLGKVRFEELLSTRVLRKHASVNGSRIKDLCVQLSARCAVIIVYIATHYAELEQVHRWAGLSCATFLLSPKTALIVYRLYVPPLQYFLTGIVKFAYRAVHAKAGHEGECGQHDVCSICLESVCISSAQIAAVPLSLRIRGPALSACRMRPFAGISAARCMGTESGVFARRVASLHCGHTFHAECVHAVVQAGQQKRGLMRCPMCRAGWESDWPTSDEQLLQSIGMLSVFFLYGAASWWT